MCTSDNDPSRLRTAAVLPPRVRRRCCYRNSGRISLWRSGGV
jgi:hypothetical protein